MSMFPVLQYTGQDDLQTTRQFQTRNRHPAPVTTETSYGPFSVYNFVQYTTSCSVLTFNRRIQFIKLLTGADPGSGLGA